ncbi:hypothetical protein BC937DRAFT_87398 [Endogone sp. FLAS-F59071]|nr:hypothetical protein BC937DRAFT_87398 [Endogone sp. FLAS-F59071]|eukprot:RUS19488.1 hypothetical protein BC937DRAFT_87398 [Endogone sp. FLAS-F59071]
MTQITQQPYENTVSLNLRRQNQRAGGSEDAAAAKNDEASTVKDEGEDAAAAENDEASTVEDAAAAKNDEASTVEGEGEDAAAAKNDEASTAEGEDEDATVVAKGVEATDLPPAPLADSQPNADSKLNSNLKPNSDFKPNADSQSNVDSQPKADDQPNQPIANKDHPLHFLLVLGNISSLLHQTRPMVIISILVCLIALIASISTFLAPRILCRLPSADIIIPSCLSPIVALPNIAEVIKTQLEVLKDYDIALSSYSIQLVDLRSAMRDVATQIKHSGLTQKSKEDFGMSLNDLIEATLNAADSMESLEARTSVTLGYFIQYNRNMLNALQALDPKNRREQIKVALDNLESTYLQVMSNMEKDMRKLELHAREVAKYYLEMDMHLGKAYETYVEENKFQKAGSIRLSKAWSLFGKNNVKKELFENNLKLLEQFEEDKGERQKQIDRMLNGVRRYIKDISILREETRDTMLEKKEVDVHIESINFAIERLGRKLIDPSE